MPSFEEGVPESLLSMFSRRSSSEIRRPWRRRASRSVSSAASAASAIDVSDAICSSFAAMTSRSCAFTARSSAMASGTGSPGTREGCHARPRHANRRTPNPAESHAKNRG
jgi:hypothetical protein